MSCKHNSCLKGEPILNHLLSLLFHFSTHARSCSYSLIIHLVKYYFMNDILNSLTCIFRRRSSITSLCEKCTTKYWQKPDSLALEFMNFSCYIHDIVCVDFVLLLICVTILNNETYLQTSVQYWIMKHIYNQAYNTE